MYSGPASLSSPRNSLASPQDLSGYRTPTFGQYEQQQRYNQPQDLSNAGQQPQDLSMSHTSAPQDLSKSSSQQPLDFSSHHSPQQQHFNNHQPVNLAASQYPANQKPLNVMVNDPYRQAPHTPGLPMTPGDFLRIVLKDLLVRM